MSSRVPDSDRRIELYNAGYSCQEIAAITHYSKSAVYAWLVTNEVEMRPPGQGREITAMRLELQKRHGEAA